MLAQQITIFALLGQGFLGQAAPTSQPAPLPVQEASVETAPTSAQAAPQTSTESTEGAPALAASPTAAPASVDPPSEAPIVKAKFGQGFSVATPDDRFSVRVRARMQLRVDYLNPTGSDNSVAGAMIRRARLLFEGNAWGPELTYYIQFGFSNRDTEPDLRLPLRDARVTYTALRDLSIQAGQMKVPYGRQRVTSSSAQQMVDRSIVVSELNLDRDVGAFFFSKDLFGWNEVLGYSLGVFAGDGRNRLAERDGFLYVGRINATPFGSFDDNVESDLTRDPRPRLAIGVSAAYNQDTNRSRSTFNDSYADDDVTFDYTHLGADFMFKWHGFFATGEWMYRGADTNLVEGVDDSGAPTDYYAREAWGAFGQVGQMLTESLELSARYGRIEPMGETDPNLLEQQEMGGAFSYYISAHNLKLQTDYFYYVFENDFSAGSHEVRSQFQLFF